MSRERENADEATPRSDSSGNGVWAELRVLLKENKKWWLLPIIVVLLLVALVVFLSDEDALPFVYTLF